MKDGFNWFYIFCRVKELGPGGPVEGKPAEIALPNNYNLGVMSPQNSDLALLRTANVSFQRRQAFVL